MTRFKVHLLFTDPPDSQSSRLNYLCCSSIHQNYLQDYSAAYNLPSLHRLRCNIAYAKLQDLRTLVPEH